MVRRNFVKLGERRDVLEFFAQQFAVGKSLRIGHQTRAHGPDGLVFASPFLDGEPAMPLN